MDFLKDFIALFKAVGAFFLVCLLWLMAFVLPQIPTIEGKLWLLAVELVVCTGISIIIALAVTVLEHIQNGRNGQ